MVNCINKNLLYTGTEILQRYFSNGGTYLPATMYLPKGESFSAIGLGFTARMDLIGNYLPKTGYTFSGIDTESIGKEIYLIKGLPISYIEAIFFNDEVIILDIEEKRIYTSHVTWAGFDYHGEFTTEDGKTYRSSDYENKYVFLRKIA